MNAQMGASLIEWILMPANAIHILPISDILARNLSHLVMLIWIFPLILGGAPIKRIRTILMEERNI